MSNTEVERFLKQHEAILLILKGKRAWPKNQSAVMSKYA